MSVDELNSAIEFIQQGQPERAQPILQALIQANQQDLAAWSWYVKSCATPEKRLKALELCLRFNPGNAQVQEAIEKLSATVASRPPVPAPEAVQPFSSMSNSYEIPYQQVAVPATSVALAEPAAVTTAADGQPAGLLMPDEPASRPFPWYEVWFKALTQANAPSYFEILCDPTADTGRAYLWMFTASLVTGLLLFLGAFLGSSLSKTLEQASSLTNAQVNSNVFYIILLILIPIGAAFNVFWAILSAGFYNLLARMLGGTGNFSRTIYLMAAYEAPLSLVNGLLSMIPIVVCLTLPLYFYGFWLNVRSIQVAHRMPSTGRAFMVVFIPLLIYLLVLCLVAVGASQSLMNILRTQTPPTY